jgi:hypothetical protein
VPGSYIPKFSYAHPEDAENGTAHTPGSLSDDTKHEGIDHEADALARAFSELL